MHNLSRPDPGWALSRLGPEPDRGTGCIPTRLGRVHSRLACQTRVHGAVVIRRLLDNPQDIIVLDLDELHGVAAGEGKELELAVLFSDIRNFTAHTERNLPYDVVHILNRHFIAAAEPVLNNNGFIDKYIGDGILAVFGTRGESPASTCRNAVRAALLMQDAAQRLCPVFEHEFNMPLRIGIGIHFGPVILGRIGHPGKRQFTVIGDTVNAASRIESMTKELGVPILVSDSVVGHLPGALRLGSPTEARLKAEPRAYPYIPARALASPIRSSSYSHRSPASQRGRGSSLSASTQSFSKPVLSCVRSSRMTSQSRRRCSRPC